MMKIIRFLIAAYFVTSCNFDKTDDRNIEVFNKSDKDVYCIISTNDSIKTLYYYNGFPNRDNSDYRFWEIKPDSIGRPNDRPRVWETLIQASDDSKIRLFFIEKDSVVKYGWDELLRKNIYSSKQKLSIENLKNAGWQIEYRK